MKGVMSIQVMFNCRGGGGGREKYIPFALPQTSPYLHLADIDWREEEKNIKMRKAQQL